MVERNALEELVKLIFLVIGLLILVTILRNGMTWFASWLLWSIAVLSSIYVIIIFIRVLTNTGLFEGDVSNAIFLWGIPLLILILIIVLHSTIDFFHTEINFYIFPIIFLGILSPIGFAWLVVWKIYNIKKESLWISIICFFVIVVLSSILFEEYVTKLYFPSQEYDSSILIILLIITLLTVLLSYGITYILIEINWISLENDY